MLNTELTGLYGFRSPKTADRRFDVAKRVGLWLCAVAVIVCASLSLPALGAEGEVSRRVLGLYNSHDPSDFDPNDTSTQNQLDMPLNHLGMHLEWADVNKPLPDPRPYRAIVVWLSTYEMDNPELFLPWLRDAVRSGVRLIMPDGLNPPTDKAGNPVNEAMIDEIYAEFGMVQEDAGLGDDPAKMQMHNLRPEKFGFETNLANFEVFSPVMRAESPGLETWQVLENIDDPARHCASVVVGDKGGWCISDRMLFYTVNIPGMEYRVAWNIDPFAFLEAALGLEKTPRPDVTTFWGARGAYSHVDVDGPYNLTQDVPGPSRYAFEVIYNDVLAKYPFPVTLGFITSEYDPEIDLRYIMPGETPATTLARPRLDWEEPHRQVATKLRNIATKALALPHIQAGCHSYTHLLNWKEKIPGYAIAGYEVSYEQEIRGAIEYLNKNVLPPNKQVELFQWPGDCDPPEEAIAILSEMGIPNINGGDPLYDQRYSSVAFVCALSALKGSQRQIYTSGSNENIYTHGWTGFKGAFINAITTFKMGDSPRRLLPVNIYYHAFPAESEAGVLAIQHVYEWAAKQDLCWMRAVEYVHAAEDFFKVRMGQGGDGSWWAENYGKCRTLRFDNEERAVDMKTSRNVAGYSRANKALYVSLLPGDRAEVRFTDSAPTAPCLARSSGMLEDIVSGPRSWSAKTRVWGEGFIELWAPNGNWKMIAQYPGGNKVESEAERFSDGRIRFFLPDAHGQQVEVHIEN